MAVPVPGSTTGSIVAEYAATNISINRMMVTGSDGFLTSAFSANLNYEKKKYIVDADGHKIAVVNEQPAMPPTPGPDENRGYINLDATAFATYFSHVCSAGDVLGELVATLADDLIHEDLIARGILTV